MPEIEHNAEGFHYKVYWKRRIQGQEWLSEPVHNWRSNNFVIPNQPTFQPYLIKVIAINKRGEANVAAKEVVGYSGEDCKFFFNFYFFILILSLVPKEAPQNLTLGEVTSATDALLSWLPVRPELVNGHFKGYKVNTFSFNFLLFA